MWNSALSSTNFECGRVLSERPVALYVAHERVPLVLDGTSGTYLAM